MSVPTSKSPSIDLTVAFSRSSKSTAESAEFLQGRLRTFCGLLAAVFAGLYVLGFVVIVVALPQHLGVTHKHPVKLQNAAVVLEMAFIWYVLGRWKLALPILQGLDVLIAALIVIPASLALSLVPVGYAGAFGGMLIMMFTLTLRAALVPSPPRRTVAIALLCSAFVIGISYHLGTNDPALPMGVTPAIVAMGSALWCMAVTGATTLTSRVIYGLQREVENAQKLGQYTLDQKLGEGGMGAVYLAHHAMLRRPTAIKLLLPNRTGAASLARFEREVQLTSMLTHPNTIAIYDYGRTTDGLFYYAMEYIDGVSLEDLVQAEGALPAARVIHVLRQIAGALGEAHRVGLIHRDVKPANVLLCERGGVPDTVKVVDFGLVKQLEGARDATVTQADTITGTPAYLAPEMIASPESIDARADLYCVGGVAYFMLTGAPVFAGGSLVEVCGHHLHTEPEPPSKRTTSPIPNRLEALILKLLAKNPGDRPASASVMEEELAALAVAHPWSPNEARGWWRHWRKSHPSIHPSARANATTVPN